MDFEEIMKDIIGYLTFAIIIVGLIMSVIVGIKKYFEQDEYLKECERKAILYDYIMEQNGDGE